MSGADAFGSELVLAVPRASVADRLPHRGVRPGGLDEARAIIAVEGRFRPRAELEQDPGWKQVIPYVVVRDGARLLLMRRTRQGADARLHDLYSIGVGGHLNPGDLDIDEGMRREWREELAAAFEPDFRPLGLLNDDDDPVGAVHLGLLFEVDAAARSVAIRETHKLAGWFAPLEEIRSVRESMEGWSSLVFDHLQATPAVR